MRWQYTTIILCIYGFLKEFRPSEPYLYQYEHITLNISANVLNGDVYPIWTYSYMIALIPVFLFTDLFLYKPIILVEAVSFITVWALFVFFGSVLVQQIIEFFYGWATATEIAYFSYIYVKVERSEFKRVTSYTRGAVLGGRCFGYILAQVIILTKIGSYRTLNWISLISLCISFVFAIILPAVTWQSAYKRKLESKGMTLSTEEIDRSTYKEYVKLHMKSMYSDMKSIYSDSFNLKWSIWWAFASCANFQIGNYTQTLWGSVKGVKNSDIYNGITEALCPLIALPVVLLMQRLRVDWPRWGELCLCIFSLLDSSILFLLAKTNNLFVMYAGYIVYRVLYQAMITIAQFNLAERLKSDSYGFVFGLNTWLALTMQSLLTLIVVDSHGLGLSIRPQFFVYSGYHLVVSIIFAIPLFISIIRYIRQRLRRRNSFDLTLSQNKVSDSRSISISDISFQSQE